MGIWLLPSPMPVVLLLMWTVNLSWAPCGLKLWPFVVQVWKTRTRHLLCPALGAGSTIQTRRTHPPLVVTHCALRAPKLDLCSALSHVKAARAICRGKTVGQRLQKRKRDVPD